MKHFFALGALLFVVGCASGSLTVQETAEERPRVSTVVVEKANATVAVDPEIEAAFEKHLREDLYADGPFLEGEELIISYRFVQLNKGSQATRYFIGFGAGKGTLTIEVVFKTPDGVQHGKINVGGEISGGFFGGDFDGAVSEAAKQAAEFAANNFSGSDS